MLKDAKVVTSKFLELKNKLDTAIKENELCYNQPSPHVGYKGTLESWQIRKLQETFGELCELLHELVVEDFYG